MGPKVYGWETECEEGLVGTYYVGIGMYCWWCLSDDQRGVLGYRVRMAGRGLERVPDKPSTLR